MRSFVWILSGLVLLTASAPSRADFTMRLGGNSVTDVPFQTLVDEGEATVEATCWGGRVAVGGVRVAVGTGVAVGVGAYRVGVGAYRVAAWPYYRPYYGYYGFRPYLAGYYRPWSYAGYYRPYDNRPNHYGGYTSYYSPSYSSYAPYSQGYSGTPVLGSSYYAAPPNAYQSAPVMPPTQPEGDGTYPYDGGPQAVPYSGQQPAPMSNPPKTVPREGRLVLLTASAPVSVYPAYGEQQAPAAKRVEPPATRFVSLPARISYPAYGDVSVRTLTARAESE